MHCLLWSLIINLSFYFSFNLKIVFEHVAGCWRFFPLFWKIQLSCFDKKWGTQSSCAVDHHASCSTELQLIFVCFCFRFVRFRSVEYFCGFQVMHGGNRSSSMTSGCELASRSCYSSSQLMDCFQCCFPFGRNSWGCLRIQESAPGCITHNWWSAVEF